MTKIDIHQTITDQIITHLEAGNLPWKKDWKSNSRAMGLPLRATGEHYQGVNVLLLWMAAIEKNFSADRWMTFRQAKMAGGNVRKGERGTRVVFYSTFEREDKNGDPQKIPFLKTYSVFNVGQIDNLPADPETKQVKAYDTGSRPIDEMETFFAATGADIRIDGRAPCYSHGTDSIHMPPVNHFETAAGFYATLCHELAHWTGHKTRLNRNTGRAKTEYAFEELIAEIGSCFIAARIGVEYDVQNTAAYLGSWLKALKNDKKFIFRAASAAQKACDYAIEIAK